MRAGSKHRCTKQRSEEGDKAEEEELTIATLEQ